MIRADEPSEPAEEPAVVLGHPVTETKRGLVVPQGADFQEAFGPLGRPFSRHSPFYLGFWGFLGVVLAYVVYRALADISGVLIVIGVALFLAVGLEPAVAFLQRRAVHRNLAVVLIILLFLAVIAGFVASAVPPISHEVSTLTANLPHYRREVASGKGWLGHFVREFHLQSYVQGRNENKIKASVEGGVLGAGKVLLSVSTGVVSGIVLTIYFLVALPRVRVLAMNLVPATRRERATALTDEVFSRVGGFVLGNLLTSIVSGLGTFVWLVAFGVPYPLLLGIFVALFDLIPVVGSTVAGLVVALVALVRGLPIAIATAAFYVAYRFFEDYLLTPRVMRHTVRISPGLTIIATLIGGTLLGLVGALIAIPCAATIYLLLEEVVFPRMDQA